MNHQEFSNLLHKASKQSYDFAKQHVVNELPEKFLYMININSPYEQLVEDEESFPELAMGVHELSEPLTHEDAILKLYQNQKVPEWIDISVFKTDKDFTYFTLTCCNRFTAKEELLYYTKNKNGPFGIKSPVFPPSWEFDKNNPNRKFDLETRQKLFYKESIYQKVQKIIKKLKG